MASFVKYNPLHSRKNYVRFCVVEADKTTVDVVYKSSSIDSSSTFKAK